MSVTSTPTFIPQPLKEKIFFPIRKPKVLVLAGPTCVGKTRHSVLIAQSIGGEIISADSMQVYRGMDIGTAKAGLRERALVQHHLLDICELKDRFNVAAFYDRAREAITQILARGNTPIVVGGTGFYIHSLLYGPPEGPPSELEVRKPLEEEMSKLGSEILYSRLKELDPEYAREITCRDRHKIIRGLEILSITGQKVSSFPKREKS